MAASENRVFHVAAVLLTAVAGVLGYLVTKPHPQALLFGVLAAAAALVPAELIFLIGERPRPPARERRVGHEPDEDDDYYGLLRRTSEAARRVPAETLSDAIGRALDVLRARKGEKSVEVERLRAAVKGAIAELERYADEKDRDSVKAGPGLQVEQYRVEAALEAVKPR